MKFSIVIYAIIIVVITALAVLAFRDSEEKGICTETLEVCLNDCDNSKFFEGGYCVFRCSLTNTVCLIASPLE